MSHGAISFFLDHFVKTRVSKVTIGVFGNPIYDSKNPEHVKRKESTYIASSGEKRVTGYFCIILPKVNEQLSSLLMAFRT